ncbi:MAG: carboxypeptidase-like regulatory domain-containing protein [Bdellovibrionota bacterium]
MTLAKKLRAPLQAGATGAFFLLAAAVSSLAYEAKPVPAGEWGSLEGTVSVDRPVTPVLLPVTKAPEICGYQKVGGVVAADQRLKDAAVYLDEVPVGKPLPVEPVRLDQQRCAFIPRVFTLAAGQPLVVRNSDDTLHTVRAEVEGLTLFNLAMPTKSQELWKKPLLRGSELLTRGRVKFSCEAGHTWMESWAVVLSHPYATVTSDDGRFRIDDVPPGTYHMIFWHPVLGESSQSITLRAGENLRVNVTLPVPDS